VERESWFLRVWHHCVAHEELLNALMLYPISESATLGQCTEHHLRKGPAVNRHLVVLFFIVACASSLAPAQEGSPVQINQITETMFLLTENSPAGSVNIVASVGPDGILLVDTGFGFMVDTLRAALKRLTGAEVKIIVNTHAHTEHTGGNAAFGQRGIVVGQARLRTQLRSGAYLMEEFPDDALPGVTFEDSLILYFNGEKVRLFAVRGGHDDNNTIIHFTGSGVACVGGIVRGRLFPTVDRLSGDINAFESALQQTLANLPEGTRLIPGHGGEMSVTDLREVSGMIKQTTALVLGELAKGKDVSTLQRENVLKPWNAYADAFISTDRWIQLIADGTRSHRAATSIIEPLYYTLRKGDGDAAVALYRQLKKEHPDDFVFGEGQINRVGYYLLANGRTKDAITIFQLNVQEHPEAWNVYDSLGEAYMVQGNNRVAMENYKKSLKLNPKNTNAIDMLKQLEAAR
jgi:glyoxylase-like metal-dependent hydrolase (beta-lactamase superfamily II)